MFMKIATFNSVLCIILGILILHLCFLLFRYLQENKLTTLPSGLFGALAKLKVLWVFNFTNRLYNAGEFRNNCNVSLLCCVRQLTPQYFDNFSLLKNYLYRRTGSGELGTLISYFNSLLKGLLKWREGAPANRANRLEGLKQSPPLHATHLTGTVSGLLELSF